MKLKNIIPVAVACMVAFAPVADTTVNAQDNTTTVTVTQENTNKNNNTGENTTNNNTSNQESNKENQKPKKIKGIKIRYKQTDKSEVVKGSKATIDVNYVYERVVLKGKQTGLKKINKQLKNYSNNFFVVPNGQQSIIDQAKEISNERTENDTYEYSAGQTVSYVGKKYVSICEFSYWYAGGVHNTIVKGHTFNLKTGKEVKKITKFTKVKNLDRLKKAIKKIVKKSIFEGEPYYPEAIDKKKATDFDFYIDKDGSVKVCFEPYEVASGGWYREYKLKGRLK